MLWKTTITAPKLPFTPLRTGLSPGIERAEAGRSRGKKSNFFFRSLTPRTPLSAATATPATAKMAPIDEHETINTLYSHSTEHPYQSITSPESGSHNCELPIRACVERSLTNKQLPCQNICKHYHDARTQQVLLLQLRPFPMTANTLRVEQRMVWTALCLLTGHSPLYGVSYPLSSPRHSHKPQLPQIPQLSLRPHPFLREARSSALPTTH